MFDYMGAFLFRSGFAHAGNVITKRCSKTITWLLLSRLQGNKPRSPEPSGTFRNLPPEPTPARAGTRRNLLEPSSGTCSCDPHRRTPELIWAEDPISLRCWGKKDVLNNTEIVAIGFFETFALETTVCFVLN